MDNTTEIDVTETIGALSLIRIAMENHPAVTKYLDHTIYLLCDRLTAKASPSHTGNTWWFVCSACNSAVNMGDRYCHECGRALTWEVDKHE